MIKNDDKFALFPEKNGQKVTKTTKERLSTDEKAQKYWDECLEIIKDNVDDRAFKIWFTPLKALKLEGNLLTIQSPSPFLYEWVEDHYYDLLRNTIARVMGEKIRVQYEVVVTKKDDDSLESRTIRIPAFTKSGGSQGAISFNNGEKNPEFPTGLNPRYNFDSFVVGENNQLAHSAATAIAQKPGGTSFNPLFIYGRTGLGKTHLIQAIGNHIIEKNSNLKVRYTTSDIFTLEFINSIQNNKSNEFINFYRNVDVLIVDDIQFFSGKEKTQDNFFHTFNALHQAGKQIIIASDKAPKEILGLDERLISRFQWGLTVDIQKPELETRMAILQKKASKEGIELPFEVMEYIATNVISSIRELEGCLIRLIAEVAFEKKDITLELAKEVVDGISRLEIREISIDLIKETVSQYYGISIQDIVSKSRKHEIALARQMSMYLSKKLTNLSLKNIGANFGGRDHSTVLHSCKSIDNYLATDRQVKGEYEKILNMIKS